METAVGALDGPDKLPPEVQFFAKAKRDEENINGYLIWTGTLALLTQVDLTADSFAELVEMARQYLNESFPEEAIPMRVYIVPDASIDTIRVEQIAEVSVWPIGDHPGPGWLF